MPEAWLRPSARGPASDWPGQPKDFHRPIRRDHGDAAERGVPILSGLKMTAGTIGNSSFEIATRQSIRALARGQSLAGHLERSALFPSFVVELVRAGEKSGQLDEMFNRIARHCEAETETAISILLKLLEPAAVLLAGCFVGGIVASLYLPIFSLTGHLAKQY